MIGIEGWAVMLGGPQATCLLVGERDGGLVVTDAFGQRERPGTGSIERLLLPCSDLRTAQHGAGAVDERHAQVHVAAFGNASEPARAMFFALLGSVAALLVLTRLHDRQIELEECVSSPDWQTSRK
jgi:hypothetical protein